LKRGDEESNGLVWLYARTCERQGTGLVRSVVKARRETIN
jgi:hypothetical protein